MSGKCARMVVVVVLLWLRTASSRNSSLSLRGSAPKRSLKSSAPCQGYDGNNIRVFAGSHAPTKVRSHKNIADLWCKRLGRGKALSWTELGKEENGCHSMPSCFVMANTVPQDADSAFDKYFEFMPATHYQSCGGQDKCVEMLRCTKDTFIPDKEQTAAAFLVAADNSQLSDEANMKARITDNWDLIEEAIYGACIADAREFSMFIANIMQESAELSTKVEYKNHYDDDDYDWGRCNRYTWHVVECTKTNSCNIPDNCKGERCPVECPYAWPESQNCDDSNEHSCKVQYFGRGYLQTSWYENYRDAFQNGGCNLDVNGQHANIENNPDLVGMDEKLAWCTAGYYWRTNVHEDRCMAGCNMGNTIHAINVQECDKELFTYTYEEHAEKQFIKRLEEEKDKEEDKAHWDNTIYVLAADGNTVNIDSSSMEIPKDRFPLTVKQATTDQRAQRRFCYYKAFYEAYSKEKLEWVDPYCRRNLGDMCPLV